MRKFLHFPIALVCILALTQYCRANVLPLFQNISTVPSNGDGNPYGLVVIPPNFQCSSGLREGDILVANFNNKDAVQGTGTTVVRIDPETGQLTTFYNSPLPGLSAALGVLSQGFILVGNVPNMNGNGTVGKGALQVVSCNGSLVTTIVNDFVSDPWFLHVFEKNSSHAIVFLSNVISGTVVRMDLNFNLQGAGSQKQQQVFQGAKFQTLATNFTTRPDPAAFVLGPSGLAYDNVTDVLFVASEADNKIFSINSASVLTAPQHQQHLVYQDQTHLNGPLGLVFTPEGHLMTVNGDALNANTTTPSELVEFTINGNFVAAFSIDSSAGAGFNLAFADIDRLNMRVLMALDDVTNSVQIYSQGPTATNANVPV